MSQLHYPIILYLGLDHLKITQNYPFFLQMKSFFFLGNIVSILVLTNKDIDLKPSFVNILICLVSLLVALLVINQQKSLHNYFQAFYDLMFELLAVMVYSLEHISQFYKVSCQFRLVTIIGHSRRKCSPS